MPPGPESPTSEETDAARPGAGRIDISGVSLHGMIPPVYFKKKFLSPKKTDLFRARHLFENQPGRRDGGSA